MSLLNRIFGNKSRKNDDARRNTAEVKEYVYTVRDAFNSGKTELDANDQPKDFVEITYNFSADCNKDGYQISFNPHYANEGLTSFMPDKVLPNKDLKTYRDREWGPWHYHQIDRVTTSLFVRKKSLIKAKGSLEAAISEIPGKVTLTTYRYSQGYRNCCYANVYVNASSADGKTFDFILKKRIKATKPSENNLKYLRGLYNELRKQEIVAHLDRRINAINANRKGKNFPASTSSIEHLDKQDVVAYAHPFLREKLSSFDSEVSELASSRDKELTMLKELYGPTLTAETLADKRNAVIQRYDPRIAGLVEKKYDLQKPLREVKETIARLGSKDVRTMPKEDYEKVNRAYRALYKYPQKKS